MATTAKDFDNKLQGVPVKAAPSQSTSIAVSELHCVLNSVILSVGLIKFLFNIV